MRGSRYYPVAFVSAFGGIPTRTPRRPAVQCNVSLLSLSKKRGGRV